MSNIMIDDESSRLKQFIWEELDENLFVAVIFRSGHRYVVQRHFEQQLFHIKSSLIQMKWRQCLLEVISNSLSPIYITKNEVELMHEIFSWHLNSSNNFIKLRENIDYLIDFEHLLDSFNSVLLNNNNNNNLNSFIIQPVTTLDAARKNIEMWKNLQGNFTENNHNQTSDKRVKRQRTRTPILSPSLPFDQNSLTGWLQIDSKIVPFIKKQCDRLLPIEYLLKEHVISSSENNSLRSLYIPINNDDIERFNTLIHSSSTIDFILTNSSSLITLDHLIFRLKHLFFIRFITSPLNVDYIDYKKIMSFNGGLVIFNNNTKKQHIPFIYINKQKYIPQLNNLNSSSISTFCIANKTELEYLRLISLYDYLSSDDNNDYLINLSTINDLTLIPIEQKLITTVSLEDFHYQEYQRRSQQQKTLIDYQDSQQVLSGWWQPPISSSSLKQKKSLSHYKFQHQEQHIFF